MNTMIVLAKSRYPRSFNRCNPVLGSGGSGEGLYEDETAQTDLNENGKRGRKEDGQPDLFDSNQ